MEAIGTRLLDFSKPFDVSLLDQVVTVMNDPSNSQRSVANQIMVALQDHAEAWHVVVDILETSNNPLTRFFGLQILEDAIKYRWKILPADQRSGIKTYIIEKCMQCSATEEALHSQKTFVHKLDLVLVQILKHEWPDNWPTFISEIVSSSQTGEVVCENNLFILKLLSEEIFDFSKESLTTEKALALKSSLNSEFTLIFQLCEFVLENSTKASLITICLQTLLKFLSWIPLGFVFETSLISLLVTKFFTVPVFRNDTLNCLAEIASLKTDGNANYNNTLVDMYNSVLTTLEGFIPVGSSYENAVTQDEVFVQRLSRFLTMFFKNHLALLEGRITNMGDGGHQSLTAGYTHLVNISRVLEEDVGIFKICLEYWHSFTKDLYTSDYKSSNPLNTTTLTNGGGGNNKKQALYGNILTQVRLVMISQMVKPSEVLIVEDENGEIVRETTRDTEALSQYNTMHETLVYLTHLDYEDTENIMLEKLAFQVDGSEWSWNALNTLCWAIGSISGAMSEEDEKRFLVTVIKDLLGLCEMKRGKDNKAVIASNIMYVVGQYPRFLRAHWKFLKTVVNKLFEFMHELHPGVQDMACDTFLKIARKCRKKFTTIQSGESRPFVEELLSTLPTIVSDLATHQIHSFYESVASMLGAITDVGVSSPLLASLMTMPNTTWSNVMQSAAANASQSSSPNPVLTDIGTMKELGRILKTNQKVCASIGSSGFESQMRQIFNDVVSLYKSYGNDIVTISSQPNADVMLKSVNVRGMRAVKREILSLFNTFVESSKNNNTEILQVLQKQYLPHMLPPVLSIYNSTSSLARESLTLTLMTTSVNTLKGEMSMFIPGLLENVFEVTLGMITSNFEDFPEHRLSFFNLLKAVNDHCFNSLFNIPPSHQKLVVDSIVWAFKHTERNIAQVGLETLYALLLNVQGFGDAAATQGFYQAYYLALLQDILAVLTDRLHKSGFKMHATILKHMFTLVEAGHVTVSLSGNNNNNNSAFLKNHVSSMLASSFPNLAPDQVSNFVTGCFDMTKDLPSFKNHLRDVLVRIKEFASSGDSNADLYLEESMASESQAQESLMAARLAVPGLVQAPTSAPIQASIDDDL